MELRKVSMEADDDSTDSLDDRYTEPIDSEKATISRSAAMMSRFLFPPPNELTLKDSFTIRALLLHIRA